MMKRSRSIDGRVIQTEASAHDKRLQELHELGEKYREDKEKWEKAYETIDADDSIDRNEKIRQLQALRQEILETQEKYEEEVEGHIQEEIEELQGCIEEMNELAAKLDQQVEKLSELRKVTDGSGSEAVTIAQAQAEKAKRWVSSQTALQQSRIDRYKEQMRKIKDQRS